MTKSRFQKICLIASLLLCVMHPESHIKAVKAESPLDYTCTMTNSPHPLCEERIKGTCMSFKWLHMAMLSWIPKRIIVCRGGQHTETTSTKERRYLSEHQEKKNKAINLNTRNKKGYKNLNYSMTAVHKQLFMRGREQLASSSTSL